MPHLSKSRYLAGIQCPKILWLTEHLPEEAGEPDEQMQRRFDIGQRVGEYAQQLFPKGVLVSEDHKALDVALEKTREHLHAGAPAVYEATVEHARTLCRADILKKVRGKANLWDLYEVKSTNSVKPEKHYPDVAVQKHCFEGAGYPVRKVFLTHCNAEYVRKGKIDPEEFLISDEITGEIGDELGLVGKRIREFLKVMESKTPPDIEVGRQCVYPYPCAFCDHCHAGMEEEGYPVGDLYRGGRTTEALEGDGVSSLEEVTDDYPLSQRHRDQVSAVKSGKPVIYPEKIREFLDTLEYPIYHFDFETVSCAIPLFDNSRPYQTLPVQFSLHVQPKPCGPCKHHEFLCKHSRDPRKELIESMLKLLGNKGTILAYNMSFETRMIKELARDFPKSSKPLKALIPRFRDLIVPFRSGHYVHRDMHGSASLKFVLPALVPKLSYDNLEVQEGGQASLILERWYDGDLSEKEWERVYPELLKYCERDTVAMVELLRVLYETVGQ